MKGGKSEALKATEQRPAAQKSLDKSEATALHWAPNANIGCREEARGRDLFRDAFETLRTYDAL
jgi:hypothetical protein